MNKSAKFTFYASTGLLTVMMLLSAGMYFFNTAEIKATFSSLGFPEFIVYPLATAKLLGLFCIWFFRKHWIKEWAYAGFFFNFLLAFSAHMNISDGDQFGALIALVLLFTSYFSSKRMN